MAKSHDPKSPLSPKQLRRRCDPASLGFKSSAELEPADGMIGQSRALNALDFGIGIEAKGYNIFALGVPGSGRHNAVNRFLEPIAEQRPAPDDWVYVHNFEATHVPNALRLPAGRGPELATALEGLIDGLKTAMPAVFESEDYQERRNAIDATYKSKHDETFKAISQRAREKGLGLLRSPAGVAIVPMHGGEPIKPDVFERMPKAEREAIEKSIKALQSELAEAMQEVPRLDKERREEVRELNRQLAEVAVDTAIADVRSQFKDLAEVSAHLDALGKDLASNAALFVRAAEEAEQIAVGDGPVTLPLDLRFNRYKANVIVCHERSGAKGAPIVYDDFSDLGHLLGRIEQVAHMGAMLTDFTLIKPGSLHQANGGFLLLDAERVLTMPLAWPALKRCLRSHQIAIESPMTSISTVTAVTLEPEAIPLDVKVIMFGQRRTFYLLSALDPDFDELFKVAADFDEITEWDAEALGDFSRLLGSIARGENTAPLSAGACARIIEHAARLASDAERLTLRVRLLADLIRDANYWAGKAGAKLIEAKHVVRAIDEQIHRLDRVRERMNEQITRDIVLIDTDGSAVGQINGLSVLQIGSFAFGKPTRITARARMGTGEVVDIEREVELGGPLHSKGVLILSGFLAARYATRAPVSLAASLVFEQSYGGVDGDSASSTELYALLSELSGIPLSQGLAVTGSVNQNGDVQAIGGVNEKIEGFFDICSARGLTGDQGVLIPEANTKHLMLREDVVEACKKGKFRIHAVAHIDEGIELLTGVSAGERDGEGIFPEGSINRLVEDRLAAFAEARRAYITTGGLAGSGS